VNCITHSRQCPYQDEPQQGSGASSTIASPNEYLTDRSTTSKTASPTQVHASPINLIITTPSVDMPYIELLQQWLNESYRSFVYNEEHAAVYGSSCLNNALSHPFLMHGMLAMAALHLNAKHTDKVHGYRQHATQLINQALGEFNLLPQLEPRSITAAFLFSNIVSAYQMCECFSAINDGGDEFLDKFISCMRMCRGVSTVIHGWWPTLVESELEPILSVSEQLGAEQDLDQHTAEFEALRASIMSLESINGAGTTKIYLDSIHQMQRIYNVQQALESPELNSSTSWAFAWAVNMSLEMINLLELRRPEALVILAHYTPLLHYRRSSWVIGPAGAKMFVLLEGHLGRHWAPWLKWPRQRTQHT